MADVAAREAEQQQAQARLDAQVAGLERENQIIDSMIGPVPEPQDRREAFMARTRVEAARQEREALEANRRAHQHPDEPQPDPFVDLLRERQASKRYRRRHVAAIVTRRGRG